MSSHTTGQTTTLLVRPRDPLIVRDARPFTAEPGARAETLDWPLPQTLAGALRTHIGEAAKFDWRDHGPEGGPARALRIAVLGGFPVAVADGAARVFLPAPRDAVAYEEAGTLKILRLHPARLEPGEGADLLPEVGLCPLTPQADVKASGGPAFWSAADVARWLTESSRTAAPTHALGAMPRDTRVHVAVSATTRTAQDGALFSTTGLAFSDRPGRSGRFHTAVSAGARTGAAPTALGMLIRVTGAPADWTPGHSALPMGGERRLAQIEPAPPELWPAPPSALLDTLAGTTALRVMLATPALFAGGWRPGWLRAERHDGAPALIGRPPGWDGPALRLVGAAVGRRLPVSGWDLAARGGRGGPKALRYAVPAGSVYFFESCEGSIGRAAAEALWLRSICDETATNGHDTRQDSRDGFGLALPGIW